MQNYNFLNKPFFNFTQDDKAESTCSDLEMNGATNGFCRMNGGSEDTGAASKLRQRIREMEEDQEELNNSLMALTSHFAKVRSFFRSSDVVYFDQLLGAAHTQKLVETFFSAVFQLFFFFFLLVSRMGAHL